MIAETCEIIVLEGIDGSGKTTQAKRVKKELETKGYRVHMIAFPNEGTDYGFKLRSWLQGARKLSPQALQLLFELDKYVSLSNFAQESLYYDILLLDRYWLSGVVYGVARGLDLEWCRALVQYLPKESMGFLFALSLEKSTKRAQFDRTSKKELQEKVHEFYASLTPPSYIRISAETAEIEETSSLIVEKITERFPLQRRAF